MAQDAALPFAEVQPMPRANQIILLRQRLLARIRRKYDLVTARVEVGSLSFDFTRIADPDRVLDDVAQEVDLHERLHGRQSTDQPLHLPYWAELWDSAYGIGHFLASPCFPRSLSACLVSRVTNVLDLGCGMGLAGTVAAALGARVLFADIEQPALLFARLNSLPWRRRVRTRQLDWQRDRLAEKFDLIMGADILYEKQQWPFLEPFWRAHLKPGAKVLLGEPGRQTGDLFVDWIRARGWKLEIAEQPVSTRPKPIRLFLLQLSAAGAPPAGWQRSDSAGEGAGGT
jgi:predicted nicotinamide N-methyase